MHRHWWGDERGSVSLWVVTAAMAMIVLVGLAADLGGRTWAEQNARAVAAQAARAAVQQVSLDAAARGDTTTTDTAAATSAAASSLASAGLTGTVAVTGPDTITVTVTGSYQTQFLSIIGVRSLPIHATSSATIVRVYQGRPR